MTSIHDQPAHAQRRPMFADPPSAPACGLRRADPAARDALALADSWSGLPEGVTRWRLAAALRAAARPLGLRAAALRLVEHYIDLSYDQDWASDSEPVICRPLVEIAEALSLGERQVRNLERQLVEKGLLAFRDSGNHHRRGRRDRRTGKLVYAYGPSLAPLGARAAEIIALAAAARAEIAASRQARLALSGLRRRLRAALVAAEIAGIDAADIAAAFGAEPERVAAGHGLTAIDRRAQTIRDLIAALETRLDAIHPADATADGAGQPAISFLRNTDTVKLCAMNGLSTASEHQQPKPIARTDEQRDAETPHAADHGLGSVPLALALAAAGPQISSGSMGEPPTSWRNLVDAARAAAPSLGIDQPLWGDTCLRLGRGGAALAAIVLEGGLTRAQGGDRWTDRGDGPAPIRAPAAYLRGMLARAEAGTLRLDRSIRALARRRLLDIRTLELSERPMALIPEDAPTRPTSI